jgi:penicillin-binding protein 1A
MGYDNPKPLGSTNAETGGGLSLPIWISFMKEALQGVPVVTLTPPEGVSKASGDWTYNEFAGAGIRSLGLNDPMSLDPAEAARLKELKELNSLEKQLNSEERKSILDLFKN